eukprot:CAMPEP_0181115120 /NCGR_PEP_ID=MMETSP1071-20121207/21265_1 /TAXON_ID=35127 /ORGANISM="Thalassiosira sp., Strain NH16" /LENGTH=130 /DNA_ID=CAMNT_0023199311 /DNA_START=19 /DNA_END=408 /DNA_ORIENTATION=-
MTMDESNLQLANKPAAPLVKVAPFMLFAGDNAVDENKTSSSHDDRRRHHHPGSDNNNNNSNSSSVLDFIGPSAAFKSLFSLPYEGDDRNVSVALHNMGNGTILLDSGEDFVAVAAAGNDDDDGKDDATRR